MEADRYHRSFACLRDDYMEMTETAAEHEQGLAGQTKAELVKLLRSEGEVRGLSKLNKS